MELPNAAGGTALAVPDARVQAQRYQGISAAQIRRVVPLFRRRGPIRFGPVVAVVAVTLVHCGYPRERIVAVTVAMLALMIGWSQSARPPPPGVDVLNQLLRRAMASTLVLAFVAGSTGGLWSPLLPYLFTPCVSVFVVCGRSRESEVALRVMIACMFALAVLPASWTGSAVPWPHSFILYGLCMLSVVLNLRATILVITDAYRETGETLDRMREEIVSSAAVRTRSMESIGAKVAHELKNPLAAIKGLVQLCARGAQDAHAQERFDVIQSEITRMEAILRDYLSFSRPLDELHPEHVDLGALVDDVITVLDTRARDAEIRLTRTGQNAIVVGDPRRLKDALMSLVSNALDASTAHSEVVVQVRGLAEGAAVAVRDTGRGLSPEELQRVGTPFFSNREGGTGLGVVLARTVVQQHGGDIAFASEPGHGTTVTVTLPARPGELATSGLRTDPDGATAPR